MCKDGVRLAMIACEVMTREISSLIAKSDNIISVRWMKQGLHDTPAVLNQKLKEAIREIEETNASRSEDKRLDAIVLGYGLCSNGVSGVGSHMLPVVFPRCDDCMALFLGAQERYLELFHRYKGIYWYTPGWVENAFTPSPESYEQQFREYAEVYGEDNAAYLVEQGNSWIANYRYALYIESPVYRNDAYRAYCQNAAEAFHWGFIAEEGDMSYFQDLISGNWQPERFLVCRPGEESEASFDDKKLRAVPMKPQKSRDFGEA